MSTPAISGRAGLIALQRRDYQQNIGNSGGQIPDASQTGETSPQTGLDRTQVASVSSPAQNSFSAMLGSMAAGGASPGGASPSQRAGMEPSPPAPDSAGASTFGSGLKSLLQAVLSGDMVGAQTAAAAIQRSLAGPDTQPSTPWPVSSTASESDTAPASTAGTMPKAPDPDDAQSAFKADLKSLLTAVQAGDTAASKTAASTLVFYMMSRQEGVGALPPPQWGGQDGNLRGNLASLLQSVQAGDMNGARKAATAIQGALDAADSPQSASAAPADMSAPPAVSAFATASVSSTGDPDRDATQSTFMTHLKGLLAAVQSGDAEASKSAAAALLDGLKTQAGEIQNQLASLAAPPSPGGQGAGVGNVLSSYFQWS